MVADADADADIQHSTAVSISAWVNGVDKLPMLGGTTKRDNDPPPLIFPFPSHQSLAGGLRFNNLLF